jgi:hypothetical protein
LAKPHDASGSTRQQEYGLLSGADYWAVGSVLLTSRAKRLRRDHAGRIRIVRRFGRVDGHGAIVVRLHVITYKESIKNLAGIHATISWLPDFSFLSLKTFINPFAKGKTRATKSRPWFAA